MGYGVGDFIAIDSYWISLSLDYGALGVVLYVGVFTVIIFAAIKTLLQHPEVAHGETSLLIPLISFMAAFLMIRGVYAEEGIHPLVFALLGMTVCLVSRARHSVAASKPVSVAHSTVAMRRPDRGRRQTCGAGQEADELRHGPGGRPSMRRCLLPGLRRLALVTERPGTCGAATSRLDHRHIRNAKDFAIRKSVLILKSAPLKSGIESIAPTRR